MHLSNYIIKDKKIVVATHNKGKVEEFRYLFSKYKINILTSEDLNVEDIEETGKTFEENSILKVKSISNDYLAVADDSGLCVKDLNQEPESFLQDMLTLVAGGSKPWKKFMRESKSKKPTFSAKFVCSLSLKFQDEKIFTYSGEIKGRITWPPRGKNGFGYDPFFIPEGQVSTYGEVDYQKKILTDHRSVAFAKLAKVHLKSN